MSISVGPEVRNAVLDMALQNYGPFMDYARIMPPIWGGHPSNDLLATATALAYANKGKADDVYRRRLAEQARTLVAELVSSQASNGSWDSGITSEPTTARAFWALVEARNAGIAVNKATLDKTAEFLLNQLKGFEANDNDSKAIVLHALSTDKQADFAACNRALPRPQHPRLRHARVANPRVLQPRAQGNRDGAGGHPRNEGESRAGSAGGLGIRLQGCLAERCP